VTLSRKLVLLRQTTGLTFDGFTILRLVDITAVLSDEEERFADRVLRGQGAVAHLRQSWLEVPVDGWESVFEALRTRPGLVTIEAGTSRKSEHLIGRVVAGSSDILRFHSVGSAGKWDPLPRSIPYLQISRVTLGTRYARLLRKYVGRQPAI